MFFCDTAVGAPRFQRTSDAYTSESTLKRHARVRLSAAAAGSPRHRGRVALGAQRLDRSRLHGAGQRTRGGLFRPQTVRRFPLRTSGRSCSAGFARRGRRRVRSLWEGKCMSGGVLCLKLPMDLRYQWMRIRGLQC
eukprot:2892713-Pleurochrysis_carterae.AAC.1